MACLDTMYNQNKDQQRKAQYPNNNANAPLASPRISFSNDFADSTTALSLGPRSYYRDAPVSTDFEFSGHSNNYNSMITADELFSQGKLLPSAAPTHRTPTTLRDELLVGDDGDTAAAAGFSLRPPKSARWKGFLGLKRSHIGSRKTDRGEGSSSRPPLPSHPQEMMNLGGSGSKMDEDEFGF